MRIDPTQGVQLLLGIAGLFMGKKRKRKLRQIAEDINVIDTAIDKANLVYTRTEKAFREGDNLSLTNQEVKDLHALLGAAESIVDNFKALFRGKR